MTHVQPDTRIGLMFEGGSYRIDQVTQPPYSVFAVGDNAAVIRDARGVECISTKHGNGILDRAVASRLCAKLNEA